MTISTHVLDLSSGRPAPALRVRLELAHGDVWRAVAEAVTDSDGRIASLLHVDGAAPGDYRLSFELGEYFGALGVETFFRRVVVEFIAGDAAAHYHVPLLVSPFGCTTYRGS
ncbi:MAG TPA: hydroxyisourate hydrolase [Vicinamibacterales bacterium]|nr:hydroxyisourate hydrolase [Vicinamibacterales bacterium]